MLHTGIGDLGHFAVIVSFITALLSAFSFYKATTSSEESISNGWSGYGKMIYYLHLTSVIVVIFALFFIIYNHYFEYHYAWSHSSKDLPVYYMISCFWEGQEGSFLLWIFWQAILGVFIIVRSPSWRNSVMTIYCLAQAGLTSMILGIVILNVKIGSTPFILLRDVLDAPIFASMPDFVPEDGTGLNPLLQSYWMVIHPPVLFLGFAATLIPFSFCLAGLWQKKVKTWIKPALPWALFSAGILALGIAMGAYWAYETLNFGGYWNWDPVENAVYVPWLVMVGAFHTMLIFQKNNTALKTSLLLTTTSFILILYSTFLTRSGILGEASVHSFTDLGLSGQLLIFLGLFIALTFILLFRNWKKIPISKKEASQYTPDF